ncbi:protein of unknown function (plasmid) [Caballeronia sp. S22]
MRRPIVTLDLVPESPVCSWATRALLFVVNATQKGEGDIEWLGSWTIQRFYLLYSSDS